MLKMKLLGNLMRRNIVLSC